MGISLDNKSLQTLLDLVHPDDFPFVLACEEYVADFLMNKVSPEKVTHYKISYSVREKTKEGIYKQFLVQNIAIQTTEGGKLLKVLGIHCDISHITNSNNHKLSLTGLHGEPSFLGIDILNNYGTLDKQPNNPFSKREIEVIQLMLQGFLSKEIAEILNVSKETINSHKKNALRKSQSKNSVQLVSFCLRNSII